MNITTRTNVVSNVQLDDNIRIWLLEVSKVKSFPSHMGPWGGADLRFL